MQTNYSNTDKGEGRTIQVESFSTPGRFYTVDAGNGFCSCPHAQITLVGTGRVCKHAVKARLLLSDTSYEIREVHNSRLNGLFDNTEWHLVEFRGGSEVRTVSVSYSRSGAYLDRLVAEGMAV